MDEIKNTQRRKGYKKTAKMSLLQLNLAIQDNKTYNFSASLVRLPGDDFKFSNKQIINMKRLLNDAYGIK